MTRKYIRSPWTEERVAFLVREWGRTPSKDIGAAIGVSGNAVIGKANRLGLPPIDRTTRMKLMHRSHWRAAL